MLVWKHNTGKCTGPDRTKCCLKRSEVDDSSQDYQDEETCHVSKEKGLKLGQ